jgi:hypothetical protein
LPLLDRRAALNAGVRRRLTVGAGARCHSARYRRRLMTLPRVRVARSGWTSQATRGGRARRHIMVVRGK